MKNQFGSFNGDTPLTVLERSVIFLYSDFKFAYFFHKLSKFVSSASCFVSSQFFDLKFSFVSLKFDDLISFSKTFLIQLITSLFDDFPRVNFSRDTAYLNLIDDLSYLHIKTAHHLSNLTDMIKERAQELFSHLICCLQCYVWYTETY